MTIFVLNADTDTKVYLDDYNCTIPSEDEDLEEDAHEEIEFDSKALRCYVPPGTGNNIDIILKDQTGYQGIVGKFSYNAPRIYKILGEQFPPGGGNRVSR